MPPPFDSAQHLAAIAALYRADEDACLTRLFPAAQLDKNQRERAAARAGGWIEDIRRSHRPQAAATDLLSRFGLTSQEGLSLMCLAEALLRIPDRETADALIRDKLNETNWNEALGTDAPWAMNVAGWALSLTGKIIKLEDPTAQTPGAALGRLVSRLGQPMIREAIRHAMQWLAGQFVMGETIAEALARARRAMEKGVRFSFDMLGEGARSAEDAERYFKDYMHAIEMIGQFQAAHKFARVSGISVKLSALHPRYEMAQRERVLREMVPRLASLCAQAAKENIPLTIDAEEADRLQLSLEIFAEAIKQPQLGDWEGFGFAVQAYQKRAPAAIDYLAGLAQAQGRRIHIRLVKGAYWDSEIKRAQERGLEDFPVFTRKAGTDVSYLACARRMLEAGECIMPLFGTHNAMTVAHIAELAANPDHIEFQRLHGMGEELYGQMQKQGFHGCVYAPVGDHDVLLGYLVRRILENGANSSFVHRLLDRRVPVAELTADPVEQLRDYSRLSQSGGPAPGLPASERRSSSALSFVQRLLDRRVPVAELIADPVEKMRAHSMLRHPDIRRAPDLFAPERRNSAGIDLSDPYVTSPLLADIERYLLPPVPSQTMPDEIETIARHAQDVFADWSAMPAGTRAACLEKLSDLLEQNRAELMGLLIREAGKSIPDALSEVREAVDFCRYYAMRARADFAPMELPGPTGERNTLHLSGRGVFACISPWNFPLAIFLGQVAAALVAGNCVIAKPAPQTPRIAVFAAHLIQKAGIPANVFQLALGGPEIGARLVEHPALAGVVFTGSTATGRAINRALAAKDGPIVPLIAETGGQNAMIVDSSALPEQVIDDVLTSAFRSAGQRCSALRILCLPEDTADKILTLLKGAMRELRVGDPIRLETDVGPVIDRMAWKRLLEHVACLKTDAKEIYTCALPAKEEVPVNPDVPYFAPQAWEIPSIGWLKGEVFGPILHVVRYRSEGLAALLQQINATGFGLTGGIHSRIESTVREVEQGLHAGNLYVNRSIIGAVVGVQPFGGESNSGTGPKAGGPHYLPRFTLERVTSNNTTAAGGNASLLAAAGE